MPEVIVISLAREHFACVPEMIDVGKSHAATTIAIWTSTWNTAAHILLDDSLSARRDDFANHVQCSQLAVRIVLFEEVGRHAARKKDISSLALASQQNRRCVLLLFANGGGKIFRHDVVFPVRADRGQAVVAEKAVVSTVCFSECVQIKKICVALHSLGCGRGRNSL